MAEEKQVVTMDKIISLCRRRGFIFQSSEIYGGLNGAYDYGPLGVDLKNNIRDFWWKEMTQMHDNIVGLDASILMHPRVWEASGHVSNFSDPMVDCKVCKSRFRADQIDLNAPCPVCGNRDSFTEPRNFNLMFETHIGANKDNASVVYLRPETAQGIYVDFKNVLQSSRVKIPFGIAQVGKSFRNEITTKNFIFRSCEFEQMEMQFFCKPGTEDQWFPYWREQRMEFYHKMGISSITRWAFIPSTSDGISTARMNWHSMQKTHMTSSSSSRWAGRSLKVSIPEPIMISLSIRSSAERTLPILIPRQMSAISRMSLRHQPVSHVMC